MLPIKHHNYVCLISDIRFLRNPLFKLLNHLFAFLPMHNIHRCHFLGKLQVHGKANNARFNKTMSGLVNGSSIESIQQKN